jgi:hypothetical protein
LKNDLTKLENNISYNSIIDLSFSAYLYLAPRKLNTSVWRSTTVGIMFLRTLKDFNLEACPTTWLIELGIFAE